MSTAGACAAIGCAVCLTAMGENQLQRGMLVCALALAQIAAACTKPCMHPKCACAHTDNVQCALRKQCHQRARSTGHDVVAIVQATDLPTSRGGTASRPRAPVGEGERGRRRFGAGGGLTESSPRPRRRLRPNSSWSLMKHVLSLCTVLSSPVLAPNACPSLAPLCLRLARSLDLTPRCRRALKTNQSDLYYLP